MTADLKAGAFPNTHAVLSNTTGASFTNSISEVAMSGGDIRNGTFEPQMVKKDQTRWDGFDDKILSMYAAG